MQILSTQVPCCVPKLRKICSIRLKTNEPEYETPDMNSGCMTRPAQTDTTELSWEREPE